MEGKARESGLDEGDVKERGVGAATRLTRAKYELRCRAFEETKGRVSLIGRRRYNLYPSR